MPTDRKKEYGGLRVDQAKRLKQLESMHEDGSVEHTTAILEKTQNPLIRLVMEIIRHTDASPDQLAAFLGRGMLINVASSMGVLEATEGWAAMVQQGCIGGFEDLE